MAKCEECDKESHRLHHKKGVGFVCRECSHRQDLDQPRMFGKLRAVGHKEKEWFDNKVRNTRF